jgi:hypothetical protein
MGCTAILVACPWCLAPGDDLERSWLEAVEYLAEPCHPFLVAGEGTPIPDGRHVRPWAEADERLRVFEVAEKQRGSFESFAVAPIDPLAPTPDELVFAPALTREVVCVYGFSISSSLLAVAPSMRALTKNAGRCDLSQRSRRATGRDLFACSADRNPKTCNLQEVSIRGARVWR